MAATVNVARQAIQTLRVATSYEWAVKSFSFTPLCFIRVNETLAKGLLINP